MFALDFFLMKKSLDYLEKNAKAEWDEEHGVDQAAKQFGSDPSKSILLCLPLGNLKQRERIRVS